MKYKYLLSHHLAIMMIGLLFTTTADAQLFNRIKTEVQNRVENKAIRKAGEATDATLDKAIDKVGKASQNNKRTDSGDQEVATTPALENSTVTTDYKSYDFVPGDKIIFQPDLSEEPDAELPARFTVHKGNAEIQRYESDKILHLDAGGKVIILPLLSTENYLPEQFTVELDMQYENDKDHFAFVNKFFLRFFAAEDNNYEGYGLYEFAIISNEKTNLGFHAGSGPVVNDALKKSLQTNNRWHHISIYVRKNIAKAYINEYRVAASNNMPLGASKIAIGTDGNYGIKIRNMRIAAGGADKYKKIMTDGKIVTHGILFDVNKATIKPESMGTLNEIAKLMKTHEELNFEVDGHTDSDGNDDANLKLSEARAKAVKIQLVKMGISADRLTTKGFGETRPIDSNENAEAKANNRRVEFVKR